MNDTLFSRPLGLWESYCALAYDMNLGTSNTCMCIHLQGPLDFALLRQAFHLLFLKHPMLRAQIHLQEEGYYYFSLQALFNEISIQQDFLEQANKDTYLKYFAQGVDKILHPDRSLWQALLLSIKGTEDHYLLVSIHHSILDGFSQVIFTRDLLNFYTELSSGKQPSVSSLPLLNSIENLLPGQMSWKEYNTRVERLIQEKGPLLSLPYSKIASSSKDIQSKLTLCTLDESITQELISQCKKEQLKVNSLISAALLLAASKVEKDSNGLSIYHAINLRKLATPAVSDQDVGCFVNTVLTIHKDFPTHNIALLARLIEQQLVEHRKLVGITPRDFDIHALRKQFKELQHTLAQRKYFTHGLGISNWGAIQLAQQFGPLKLLSIYRSAGRQAGYYPFFLHIATIHQQIQAAFSYAEPFFSQQRAEDYAQEFSQALTKWVQ